eukprot:4736872-Prymnesium_polylepis.1
MSVKNYLKETALTVVDRQIIDGQDQQLVSPSDGQKKRGKRFLALRLALFMAIVAAVAVTVPLLIVLAPGDGALAAQEALRAAGVTTVTAGDPAYANNTRGNNPEWNGERVVVSSFAALPSNADEVLACLRAAAAEGKRVAVRSGGHSLAGYGAMIPAAQGFVMSLERMRAVSDVRHAPGDVTNASIVISGGARWEEVYRALNRSGLKWVVNGGLCPTVGVASFTQGGGTGAAVRRLGLAVDAVESFEVAVANGSMLVNASADENADLFWALRGGGGGNFGVVTSLTMRVSPGPE